MDVKSSVVLPLLGGLVVFVVLALALLADRAFESGRRLPPPRRPRPPRLPQRSEDEVRKLPR